MNALFQTKSFSFRSFPAIGLFEKFVLWDSRIQSQQWALFSESRGTLQLKNGQVSLPDTYVHLCCQVMLQEVTVSLHWLAEDGRVT
jgi:hypothetical protein